MTPRANGYAVIIDDEKLIADTLVMILEKFGYVASAAYSGEDGVALARAFKPDIVISDVVMPGMTGLDVALALKEIHPACRVILISGDTSTNDLLQKASSAGENFEVLAKPVHPLELIKKIEQRTATAAPSEKLEPNSLQAVFDHYKSRKLN